jgi:hypothetical protein
MSGIQNFYVGGVASIGTEKQKKGTGGGGFKKTIRQRQRDSGKEKEFQKTREKFEKEQKKSKDEKTQPPISGAQTTDFIDDLKGAAQEGLFTTGNKTKAFMAKYGLSPSDIIDLRTGINTGLGKFITTYDQSRLNKNILQALVGDLQAEGILRNFGPASGKIQKIAGDIFEPGMTKYDRQPLSGIPSLSPLINLGMRGFDFLAGGSPAGMRGIFYGRNVLGLEGEELDNFAASVANNPNLFNQMMSTPEMQKYQLDEFRSQINRDFMANRQGPDDDFVAEAAETPVVVPSPGIPSAPVVPFPITGLPTQPVLVQGAAPSIFSDFPQFNLSNYAQQGIANPNLINFNQALSRIA